MSSEHHLKAAKVELEAMRLKYEDLLNDHKQAVEEGQARIIALD